jgi:outer membrane protein, multidrug efflux system
MTSRTFRCGTALALLAGCTVGPNYKPPSEGAPSVWATQLAAGESDAPAALASWWTSFKDPELDALIGTAVRSNLTLRVAEERVREARAARDVVAGGRWPSAAASVAYSKNRYGANSFPPLGLFPGIPLDYNLYNVGFDAAWELDLFGGIRRAVEASNAQIGAAEYSRRDVLVSVLAEVARNYIDARTYQERLDITRQNIAAQQAIVELTRSRYRSGLASDLEVEQAMALVTATQAQLPALESGFAQSVHHLSVLLGQDPGALLDSMASAAPTPLTPPVVPVGLPSELLRRRPDIERAERDLAASTAQIGVAEADLFPKFSLVGALGITSTSTHNLFEYASRYWSVGPTMQWDLLQGGSLRANVRVQKARAEQALDTYRQTVLVALEDAENALVAYAKEQTRRQSLAQSVDSSEAAFHLSSELYRSGLVDFLNVLDAERTLYAAQDALVGSTESVSLDLVQLYKALGGGWQQDSAPGPGGRDPVAPEGR